jgi:hypothetical protein
MKILKICKQIIETYKDLIICMEIIIEILRSFDCKYAHNHIIDYINDLFMP